MIHATEVQKKHCFKIITRNPLIKAKESKFENGVNQRAGNRRKKGNSAFTEWVFQLEGALGHCDSLKLQFGRLVQLRDEGKREGAISRVC